MFVSRFITGDDIRCSSAATLPDTTDDAGLKVSSRMLGVTLQVRKTQAR